MQGSWFPSRPDTVHVSSIQLIVLRFLGALAAEAKAKLDGRLPRKSGSKAPVVEGTPPWKLRVRTPSQLNGGRNRKLVVKHKTILDFLFRRHDIRVFNLIVFYLSGRTSAELDLQDICKVIPNFRETNPRYSPHNHSLAGSRNQRLPPFGRIAAGD